MKYGYFDESKKEYVITRPVHRHHGSTILVRRSMEQLYPIMQGDIVLQNQEQTEEF